MSQFAFELDARHFNKKEYNIVINLTKKAKKMLVASSAKSKTASQKNEAAILEKLVAASNPDKIRTYLCINEPALITALNNYQQVITNRLTTNDIILIATSRLKNCQLIVESKLYPTLDAQTQQTIATLLRNQQPKSHMAHPQNALPPSQPKLPTPF